MFLRTPLPPRVHARTRRAGRQCTRFARSRAHTLNLPFFHTLALFPGPPFFCALTVVLTRENLSSRYVMPKMMEGMDPEEKENFLKQQQTMQPQAQMPDLAGWLAGSGGAADKTKAIKKKKEKN
eukprot:m.243114 g.243114  ORF g.243114 m.243114 type:complete len:124 (-) comp26354_c0_seq4:3323-3694(-)